MRVLWFSCVAPSGVSHNGGGWITSLAEVLKNKKTLELGICFEGTGLWGERREELTFFPLDVFSQWKNRLRRRFSFECEEKLLLPEMLKAVQEFQPDVIHIWGAESAYGMIAQHTDIPCIIHLQGVLTPYLNAKYPPGFCRKSFLLDKIWHPGQLYRELYFDWVFRNRAARELRIIKGCRNYLGRTAWDRAFVTLINPEAHYFYNSEMLRQPFMEHAGEWKPEDRPEKVITSVISMPYYKGHDLILKTAKLLSERMAGKFVWNVYGGYSMKFWEKHLKISAGNVHVSLKGTVSADGLKDALLKTDVYVHPSYIDNSPNSLCEAQLLGVPVIATCVGGVPSLVEDGKSGVLVPANDPYFMAAKIIELLNAPEKAAELGRNAAACAKQRHTPETIVADLLKAYQTIR